MAGLEEAKLTELSGRVVPVRGDDIDTDRIIPARYLRTVTFENLGDHVFEDDRVGGGHPFDEGRFSGASLLVANRNFGCGSSREHAPQALMRWGLKAFVAESFAEIFFGNCVALGLPCLTASRAEIERLMAAVEQDPEVVVHIELSGGVVRFAGEEFAAQLPAGVRQQFLEGTWDAMGQLLEGADAVDRTAAALPYMQGFAS